LDLGFWICPSSAVAGYCYGGWILDLVVFGFWICFGFLGLWIWDFGFALDLVVFGFWICPSSAVAGYCYGGWILDLVVFGFWICFGFLGLWILKFFLECIDHVLWSALTMSMHATTWLLHSIMVVALHNGCCTP